MPDNEGEKLTTKSVAQLLGVSIATISNAFNRPDQLSKLRRAEILEACEKIGYRGPNRAAQILRKSQSNIVALVLANGTKNSIDVPAIRSFIKGVCAELEQNGKHLLLLSGESDNLIENSMIKALIALPR